MKYKGHKSAAALLLCVVLLFSSLPFTAFASDGETAAQSSATLTNIAGQCAVSVSADAQSGYPAENMVDGDASTAYIANNGVWPVTATFQLPSDNVEAVQKVEISFLNDASYPNRMVDVEISYAQNNVTSDPISLETLSGHLLSGSIVITPEKNMSHLYITLSNPMADSSTTGAFWAAIAEVGIYVEGETETGNFVNVAPQATVTSVGGSYGTPANLIDENDSTMYGFYQGAMASMTEEAWIQLDLASESKVSGFNIVFEHLDTDSNNFVFTYSIYGRASADEEWTALIESQTANRTTSYSKTNVLNAVTTLKQVKIVLESIECSGGTPWPAVCEFRVYADPASSGVQDEESVAWNKPVHSNSNNSAAYLINDGSSSTSWSGTMYPAYVDIDLEENYNINEVQVFTPATGYSQYTLYYSMDGRDFSFLAEKQTTAPCTASGDIFTFETSVVEARIIRVYLEYNSASTKAVVNEVRVLGEASGTAVLETPAAGAADFADTDYDVEEITPEMTYEEVNGIIERRLGAKYKDWFELELAEPGEDGYDFYELSDAESGKIRIKGNTGVSLATGLNYYLKYYCNVHISQVGDQVNMPDAIVPVNNTVRNETKFAVRYSYNYCTLSYTMSFWGEEEWRNELDWLALNGVNVVLDATGQEEVWRRFLTELGYDAQEIKDFIAGPAYYAWAYMANLSGYGGPVHDSWFEERTELARKNQLSMRKLGMQPVLQGYSGMVPVDITDKDSSAEVIAQGAWCSFQRPYMLVTTSNTFTEYAELFYKCQSDVYGDWSHYYATDPFHEGGNTGSMSARDVGSGVMNAMLSYDSDAVWVIQSWQGNPTSELLAGIANNSEHALVLDLYAEKTPHWNEGSASSASYGYTTEFNGTPWVFCMLNNFGGRMGLHGHLANLVNNIPEAANSAQYMAGIGITPEGSQNNPLLYDLLFETIWSSTPDNLEPIDLESWLQSYVTRRYGAYSESAYQALLIYNDTVYNPDLNNLGQGAPESVVNARPAASISAASTWGNAVIQYDKADLEEAARFLLADYDTLKNSEAYLYDVADLLKQILSNTAQEYYNSMITAYQSGDSEAFERRAEKFLNLIDEVEKVLGTQEEFLLGTWVGAAEELAANTDDFTLDLYRFNAKSLVTTWGSYSQSESGGLHDYSNRQWAGLTEDFYKARWQMWIEKCEKELAGESTSSINWFEFEWAWARSDTEYTAEATDLDLLELGEEILANYTVDTVEVDYDPASDDSRDLPPENMTATAGSEQAATGSEGPASNLLDNDTTTIWHTDWNGTARADQWVIVDLGSEQTVDGVRYLPRQGGGTNGIITGYAIDVLDADGNWTEVAAGTWASGTAWKIASFDAQTTSKIRLRVTDSLTDQSLLFASGAELRVTGPQNDEPEYTLGDVNSDGKIDAADATAVLQHYAAIIQLEDTGLKAAEVSGDGQITAADATLILQYYAIIITSFPAQP